MIPVTYTLFDIVTHIRGFEDEQFLYEIIGFDNGKVVIQNIGTEEEYNVSINDIRPYWLQCKQKLVAKLEGAKSIFAVVQSIFWNEDARCYNVKLKSKNITLGTYLLSDLNDKSIELL